jgi:hypothetical protein
VVRSVGVSENRASSCLRRTSSPAAALFNGLQGLLRRRLLTRVGFGIAIGRTVGPHAMRPTVGPHRTLADSNTLDAIEVGGRLRLRPVGAVQSAARGAWRGPRQDFSRQRLRDTGDASRGPLEAQPIETAGLIGGEPAWERTHANPRAPGHPAMEPPTSGHEYGLTTATQPAVSSRMQGFFEPPLFVVAPVDGDQRRTLPARGLGG